MFSDFLDLMLVRVDAFAVSLAELVVVAPSIHLLQRSEKEFQSPDDSKSMSLPAGATKKERRRHSRCPLSTRSRMPRQMFHRGCAPS